MRIHSAQNCMRPGSDVCLGHYCRTVYLVFCRQPYFLLLLLLWRFGAFLEQWPPRSPSSNLHSSILPFRLFGAICVIPPGPDYLMLSIPASSRAKILKTLCKVIVCVGGGWEGACSRLMEEPKMMFQSDHSCCCLEPINMNCSA